MSDPNWRPDQIAFEQARSKRYMAEIDAKPQSSASVSRSRSSEWTRARRPHIDLPTAYPLAGRVRLTDTADFYPDFYIGGWHLETGDLRVFSWAAPLAATFFQNGDGQHDLQSEVVARRTLISRADIIYQFADEHFSPDYHNAFAESGGLDIPLPPPVERTHPTPAPKPAAETADAQLVERPRSRSTEPIDSGRSPSVAQPETEIERRPSMRPDMRAEEAVLRSLEAPREERLSSVLSTLQPDQYDLVTRPSNVAMVVQGNPGTGKTIVALHRAAYLCNPENPLRVNHVLLIGPTDAYAKHVEGVLSSLDLERGVVVRSLTSLLLELAATTGAVTGPLDGGESDDVSFATGSLVTDTVRMIRSEQPGLLAGGHTAKTIAVVYQILRKNGLGGTKATQDPEKQSWLKTLPNWDDARRARRWLPLLAQIGFELRGAGTRFDHLVVDEAQDVRGMEWRILDAMATDGHRTLFGDMSQRRTDHTPMSWKALANDLGLSDGLTEFRPEIMHRGYRSTTPILKFAGRLLPKRDRDLDCLQTTGPEPRVVRAEPAMLHATVLTEADEASQRHPEGTTSIITTDARPLTVLLRESGWRGSSIQAHAWEKAERCLVVITPEDARGLEFDAVVVVEPAAFPQNLGRNGLLYTSLTRPNRELVVVHSKPLPDPLRRT